MHYTQTLKNNKIYYFKVTKQKKVRVSEDEYNKYNIRKYNTKLQQKGGYHASPEFENLSASFCTSFSSVSTLPIKSYLI